MASHQQLLYHLVFSTKERIPLLRNDGIRESVWNYMADTVLSQLAIPRRNR